MLRIGIGLGLALASVGAFAALAAASPAAAQGTAGSAAGTGDVFPWKTQQKVLDNGLKVVVIPFDSPGTLAYYLVVRTGSRDEVEAGHSGFAHFFEHMMFRGTEKYPKEKYTATLQRMGADSNASTDDDVTIYHIVGPSREIETMMDIESDRFQNLKYSEPDFRTEANAVLGEYNKAVSNPVLPMFEKLQDLAFQKHTYKHTTIGFLEDIKAMPGYYEYSLGFFRRFYRPENCILLLVGDVEAERAFSLAQKYYGGWQRGYQAPPITPEPPQTEAKEGNLEWPTPVRPYSLMGFHAPAFSTASTDWAAADLIGQLLFSESAPLYQDLVVEKQWVDQFFGGVAARRDPFPFTIFVRGRSEELMPKVRDAVLAGLETLKNEPVDPARLARIKSHLRYAFVQGLDSPGAVADQVAQALSLTGTVESINASYAQYEKVTPADIQRVARQIFRTENRTIVNLRHVAKSAPAATEQGGN